MDRYTQYIQMECKLKHKLLFQGVLILQIMLIIYLGKNMDKHAQLLVFKEVLMKLEFIVLRYL